MKEFTLTGLFAVAGGFISTYLGGWDAALKLMVVLMIIDYITGVVGAWMAKDLSSDAMYKGGIRKGMTLLVVIIAVLLDELLGGTPVFRTLSLYYFIGREGLSVTENLAKMGVPLPPALVNVLAQLKTRGESTEASNEKVREKD
jgi:toxin secretion/phage lysis holin